MKITVEILANGHGRVGSTTQAPDFDALDVYKLTDEELRTAREDAKKLLHVLNREILGRAVSQPIEPMPLCSCGYKTGHPGARGFSKKEGCDVMKRADVITYANTLSGDVAVLPRSAQGRDYSPLHGEWWICLRSCWPRRS